MLQRDLLRARRCSVSTTPTEPSTPFSPGAEGRRGRPASTQARFAGPTAVSPLTILPVNSYGVSVPPKASSLSSCSSRPSLSISNGLLQSPCSPGGMGETVRVAVRCRPPNPAQGERAEDVIVSMHPGKREICLLDQESRPWRVDTPLWSVGRPALDGSASVSQQSLYDQLGRPLLMHALDGYNSTLMAYGQTGSGKTYTMMGDTDPKERPGASPTVASPVVQSELGVIPRVCEDLFFELNNRSFTAASGETISWEVHVRYVEVYCERISDLLNGGTSVGIREEITPRAATFALVGAKRLKAENKEDLLLALQTGNKFRRTAATKSNERSSRSHAIFMIELTELLSFTEPEEGTVVSAPSKSLTLRLVDLAGSERVGETGVQGQQLKEARDINLSLFTLGQVIECLSDPKRRSIKPPYRNSVLTKLLRDAFGGNSKTTLICTVGPCEAQRQQTIQTLNYAAKARHVLNKPRVDEDPSALELRRANEELLTLRRELGEAQRTGQQHEAIQEQLREANERLHREQQEAKHRREAMEKREAELATRLQEMEAQRENYEAQMAALENEAEQAKSQQKKREAELRRAQKLAEENAQKRMTELQQQREESEQAIRAREGELLQRQRTVEDRLREMEANSQKRVDELLQQQRELEATLKQKESLAATQEQEMRRKQKLAEDAARQLETRCRDMDAEWAAQVQSLEQQAQQREQEVAARAAAAQERLRATEEAYTAKEKTMREKWAAAEQQSRQMQSEMEGKQSELDRRVAELNRQAQQREHELNDKLQTAEFELRQRARESQLRQEEVQSLKQAAAQLSASSRTREQDMVAQHTALTEAFHKREEQLQQREADLQAQFEQVMAVKRDWEAQHLVRTAAAQQSHDETAAELAAKGLALQERESSVRQMASELADKQRAFTAEQKRKEMELLAQRNDFDAQAQRERQMNICTKEELQSRLQHAETSEKAREERLQRREDDLTARRAALDDKTSEVERELLRREAAMTAAEDAAAARATELDQLAEKLRSEQEAMQRSVEAAEAARAREHQTALAALQRKETDLSSRFSSMQSIEEQARSKSRALDGRGRAVTTAVRALFDRECLHLCNQESQVRDSLVTEEELQRRAADQALRQEARAISHRLEMAVTTAQSRELEKKAFAAAEATRAAENVARSLTAELAQLRAELRQSQGETTELKVQLSAASSKAQFTEDALQLVRLEASEKEASLKASLQDAEGMVSALRREQESASRVHGQWAMATQLMLCDFEQQQRSLIDHHSAQERTMISLLQVADRKLLDQTKSIARWKALYAQRCDQPEPSSPSSLTGRAAASDSVEAARRLESFGHREDELRCREETLVVESGALHQRIADFDARERMREAELARQEEKITRYLLELEELDRESTKTLRDREQQLVEAGLRLREKEAYLTRGMHAAQESLAARAAADETRLQFARESLEREGMDRIKRMEEERALAVRGMGGDPASIAELLRRQERALVAESERLHERIRRAEEEEERAKRRLADEEGAIRDYLLAMETEDIRRNELSQQGQIVLREAEASLAKAQKREQDLRNMAHRLQQEAAACEERSRLVEATLFRQEQQQLQQMQQRRADLDQRKATADTTAQENERTLVDLEADLRSILNRNKDAEQAIKARDAALARQKAYHDDLSKLLAERDKLLEQEHTHRMNGKESANWLVRDLLDANSTFEKRMGAVQRKLTVLIREDKLECERCGWLNARTATVCRCCGNGELASGPVATASVIGERDSLMRSVSSSTR